MSGLRSLFPRLSMANKIWIGTIFPEYFEQFLKEGIAARTFKSDHFEIKIVDIRHYSFDKYKGVDDTPYGGGPGMVMRADVLREALMKGVVEAGEYGAEFKKKVEVIIPSPRGELWNASGASEFAKKYWDGGKDIFFICGRYEGIDERFIAQYVDREISLGDYILTGGELAVMAVLDSAIRFFPGALGNQQSNQLDSFEEDLLEQPQYTKPREFEGLGVPEILLSGHHAKIESYRQQERIRVTKKFRPDLYKKWEQQSE